VSDLPKVIHITKGPKEASVNWCGAPSDPNWPKDPDFKFGLSLPICPDCIEVFDGDTLVLRKSTAAVTRTPREAVEDGLITKDEIHDVVEKPKPMEGILALKAKDEAQTIIDDIYDDVNCQRSLKEWAS
tara:strand:- start:1 stop:387 length:387 start_codon:yes stop_codon:yes gene_type:complete